MDEISFKLDTSLRKISMISAAANLWNHPEIKMKIKKKHFQQGPSHVAYRKWNEVMEEVLSRANSLELPSDIVAEFQYIVVSIGEKIFDWITYVADLLGLNFILTEKIYITSHGTICEDKIFNFYWSKINISGLSFRHGYFKNSILFNLACLFGQETFIRNHLDEIMQNLVPYHLDFICNVENREDKMYNVMSVVIYEILTMEMLAEDLELQVNDFLAPPMLMFKLCLKKGFSIAAKYYWNRLDKSEQASKMIDALKYCLNPCIAASMFQNKDVNFILEKQCEMFYYLFNQMSEEGKSDFVAQNIRSTIRMFLFVFPYEELMVTVLDYDLNKEIAHGNLLNSVLITRNKYNRSKLPVTKNTTYKRIVKRIWENLPNSQKFSYVKLQYKNLFNVDVATLFMMLKDKNVKSREKELLFEFCEYSDSHAQRGQFDMINCLLQVISCEKLKNLIIQRSILELLGRDSDSKIQALQQYLNKSEEKLSFEDDCLYICVQLIRYGNFQFARTLLKWQFKTEEEIKKFLEMVKLEDRIPQMLLKIWFEQIDDPNNLSNVVQASNNFLKFLYESDEEVIEIKRKYKDYLVGYLAENTVDCYKCALVKALAEFFTVSLDEADKMLPEFGYKEDSSEIKIVKVVSLRTDD